MPSIDELVQSGRIERVAADSEAAQAELAMAKSHATTAESVIDEDPVYAYTGVYDAARKAVSAHMRAKGFRPTSGPGKHIKSVQYAEAAIAPLEAAEAVGELNRMRNLRHGTEYEVRFVGAEQVRADLKHARRIIEAVESDL